jgi:hypothetical protein
VEAAAAFVDVRCRAGDALEAGEDVGRSVVEISQNIDIDPKLADLGNVIDAPPGLPVLLGIID